MPLPRLSLRSNFNNFLLHSVTAVTANHGGPHFACDRGLSVLGARAPSRGNTRVRNQWRAAD